MGVIDIEEIVTLYSTGCPRCTVLKKKLSDKGIEFNICDDIDVMTSMGIMEVPVLYVNDERMDFAKAISWINKM